MGWFRLSTNGVAPKEVLVKFRAQKWFGLPNIRPLMQFTSDVINRVSVAVGTSPEREGTSASSRDILSS
jgi:hypothetical protein